MFGFGKKARQEKAKREALAIGERAVASFNDALARWRELALESRRTMIDNEFAKRLLTLEPTEALSFETVAEIEALACMKNWYECFEEYREEFASMVDQEAMQCFEAMDIESEAESHIDRNLDEVTAKLENDLDIAIAEALQRRGESTARTGRRGLAERSVQEYGYLESMNLMELLFEARGVASSDPSYSSMVAFMRRFYEIAFHGHGLTDQERDAALSTAQSFEADIIASFGDDPDRLATFHEALDFEKEQGRRAGVGSLHWKMEDEGVPAAELINYIARVENSPLLPDYLGMLDPEVISDIRHTLLQEIVEARNGDGVSTIEVLGRLAEANDPALSILLDSHEANALRNWSVEPERAQQVIGQLLNGGR